MKKTISVIIALLTSSLLFADNYEILIQQAEHLTRSTSQCPEAYINTDTDILSISFDYNGLYTLHIENSMSETVFQSALPANGMEYFYDLSGIGEGFFTLIINGPGGEYYSEFTL